VGEIPGLDGSIYWGYQLAASIRDIRITIPRRGTNGHRTARATLVMTDAFRMAQRPLIFAVRHAKGEWRWPIEEVTLQGGVVTARLGAPLEVSHGAVPVRSA
jgi:hypothetical protein